MLQVLVVFNFLEVGLLEYVAEHCLLFLPFLLEDFLFFIILLLVLSQLSLQVAHLPLLLSHLLTSIFAHVDLLLGRGRVQGLLATFRLLWRFRAYVGV